MSEDQTPDDQLSKRERQKQRRQRKLEQQRAHARAARRRRVITLGVIALLLVGATGAFAAQWAMDRAEERRLIAEAEENLDALGCTPVDEEAIAQSPHLTGTSLAQSPPETIYQVRPATSGPHMPAWSLTGVFDKAIDERLLVHNLEHGYVVAYHAEDAPEEQVEALRAFAREEIESRSHEKIVVAPWAGELEDESRFAFVAWGARQTCRDFDEGVALSFLNEYHYLNGSAPERTIQPHLTDGVDPDAQDGDVLFPPLGEQGLDGQETMDDGGEATEG